MFEKFYSGKEKMEHRKGPENKQNPHCFHPGTGRKKAYEDKCQIGQNDDTG
jgi:hypothetical protein